MYDEKINEMDYIEKNSEVFEKATKEMSLQLSFAIVLLSLLVYIPFLLHKASITYQTEVITSDFLFCIELLILLFFIGIYFVFKNLFFCFKFFNNKKIKTYNKLVDFFVKHKTEKEDIVNSFVFIIAGALSLWFNIKINYGKIIIFDIQFFVISGITTSIFFIISSTIKLISMIKKYTFINGFIETLYINYVIITTVVLLLSLFFKI